jgi:hypothetical protein
MKSKLAPAVYLSLIGLSFAVIALTTIRAEQPAPQRTRAEFMRQKLNFSKDVLEGLALEQYALIEKSAKALKKLSEAAEWEVPTIPNATDYVAMTSEFQRNTDELAKQAKKGNIEGATLAYFKVTMSCVECHKFVRFATK